MPVDNVPSQTERAFRERFLAADRRLKELERRITGLASGDPVEPGGDRFPGVSFDDVLAEDAESPPWYSTRAITYAAARISARVAGGGTGTCAIRVNGSTVVSVSLLTGELTHLYAVTFSININDEVGVLTTAAGGQSIVSVQLTEAA